jgi:hypothetical protein
MQNRPQVTARRRPFCPVPRAHGRRCLLPGRGRAGIGPEQIADVAEQVTGDLAQLDLVAAFRDAIAAVMAVVVFELAMTRIAHAAVDLHGLVRCGAGEAVRPVVADRHRVRQLRRHLALADTVHLPGRLQRERSQGLVFAVQLGEAELDRLVARPGACRRCAVPSRGARSHRCSSAPYPGSKRPGGCGFRGQNAARSPGPAADHRAPRPAAATRRSGARADDPWAC